MSITQHLLDFCDFGECYEIDDEGLICLIFFLTLEVHAKKWCHTLPKASIHSFEQLTNELRQYFHRYDLHKIVIKLNDMRMEPQESLDEFSIRFIHYCFEFPERDVDWKCLSEQFKHVILVSLEQFQLDPTVPYDDPQVTGCSYFVPNASLSISPCPNHTLAS